MRPWGAHSSGPPPIRAICLWMRAYQQNHPPSRPDLCETWHKDAQPFGDRRGRGSIKESDHTNGVSPPAGQKCQDPTLTEIAGHQDRMGSCRTIPLMWKMAIECIVHVGPLRPHFLLRRCCQNHKPRNSSTRSRRSQAARRVGKTVDATWHLTDAAKQTSGYELKSRTRN